MELNTHATLGYIGASLSTICMIPQVYTTFKTQNIEGLSLYFILLQMLSTIFSGLYGYYDNYSIPVIISNSTCFFLSTILLIMYYKYKSIPYEKISLTPIIRFHPLDVEDIF